MENKQLKNEMAQLDKETQEANQIFNKINDQKKENEIIFQEKCSFKFSRFKKLSRNYIYIFLYSF